MKRASYRAAIAWIAWNDEPSDDNPESVSEMISASLIADIFGVDPLRVGSDIVRYRHAHNVYD